MQQQTFVPGRSATDMRWLTRPGAETVKSTWCTQVPIKILKTNTMDGTQTRLSRHSDVVRTARGGEMQFGDDGSPLTVNVFGRAEGHPGGSRAPIRNRF